ncbi:MAG: molybdenum cofactor guanylyltransferase [Anaerolineae bacterium]|nr:molybdenum cofactor guanylyltransferase [Anaerolineae bacterium]
MTDYAAPATPQPAVTVAILAGGRSSRMGTDKSFVPLLGQTLIEHVIARVTPLVADPARDILLITNRPDDYAPFGLPMYTDVIPDAGSLGGLYTAVLRSQAAHTLCVACDMPFLNTALLAYLLAQRAGYDVIVPRLDGYPEPLHAVYGKGCLEPMRAQIEAGRYKIIGFYGKVRLHFIEEADVRRLDPDLRSFVNVNTPDELASLRGPQA